MSVPYAQQTLLALWSVLTGLGLGFAYEWFRIFHFLHPNAIVLIFIEDIIFSLICALSISLLFFNLSFGKMRFFGFIFTLAGFCLWYFTAGRLFRIFCRRLSILLQPKLCRIRTRIHCLFETKRMVRSARNGFGAKHHIRCKGVFVKKGKKNVQIT